MTDVKRTKRLRSDYEDLALEELIDARRAHLVAQRGEVPLLQDKIRELREKASSLTRRFEVRLRLDAEERVRELEEEVRVRLSMSREHDFESKVTTYLHLFYGKEDGVRASQFSNKSKSIEAYTRHHDETRQRRESILDEYLLETGNAPPKVAMAARDECPLCAGGVQLLLNTTKSVLCCPDCGYTMAYLDATSSSTAFDEVVEFSQYSYKRVNHYQMWLQLVQGKEAHRVPDDVLQAVMEDLYSRGRVRECADITQKRVRDSLRHLRLRKAYDHVAQITSRLSGRKPQRIPPETEEQLKTMFLKMQPAFQKHAPKTRTNFLSYSYVLYRSFQILGLHHMLEGITLLKGRDKLEANDQIFRKMCHELNWPVFDLPPASDTVR